MIVLNMGLIFVEIVHPKFKLLSLSIGVREDKTK